MYIILELLKKHTKTKTKNKQIIGQWFSLDTPFSATNKTDRHDITEIMLKVTLNTIDQTYMTDWLINFSYTTALHIFTGQKLPFYNHVRS